jgi:ATP-dependent RNA helicase DeaD
MQLTRFEDLNLSKEIHRAVKDMGFEEPTPIQLGAIPHLMMGRDVIGQAQTGTGKTAAFGIPILEKVDPSFKKPQALILCPTRELAIQVAEEITKLAKYKKGIKILPVYGGQSIQRQIKSLKAGVQIIIGTPGRVMDHMRRRTLRVETINYVVLDEADEMLDMGFREDMETILENTPIERQTALFSATMPKAILDITNEYQNEPEFVKVVHQKMTVPNVEQLYYQVKEKEKVDVLTRLIDMYDPKLSLVFCNTKRRVDELVTQLQSRGYFADGLHGDMRQNQRDRVMDQFRNNVVEVLVATDVAARGLDVDDVEAVFNFDVPQNQEYYVHRIGRTGRAGREGRAFTLVAGKSIYKLKDIQKYTKTKIIRNDIPSLGDIEEAKTVKLFDKMMSTIKDERLRNEIEMIEDFLEDESISLLEVAAALLKMNNATSAEQKSDYSAEFGAEFKDTGAEPGMVRLFINAGKKQGVRARDIVGSIASETGIPGKVIGMIAIHNNFTFVEVPREHAQEVLTIMQNSMIRGNRINIEPAKPK